MARVKKKKGSKSGKSKGKAAGSSSASKGKRRQFTAAAEKAEPKPAAPNPYDVFQNRRRRSVVLGQRSVAGEKRNLARSRAAAVQKRTSGLLQEVASLDRRSQFKDLRLGGAQHDDGVQDVQRFVKLRQKQARKTFNLDGSKVEELTVGGRPLSGLADEDLKAAGPTSGDEYDGGDLGGGMDDIVARSKQRKLEEAREKQEQEDKLGELDKDFADIMGELAFKAPKAMAPLSDKDKPDNYDQMVKKLGMERRAIATDRTKTAEELAREKAEKLEALERRRVARAEGLDLDEDDEVAAPEEAAARKPGPDEESVSGDESGEGEEGEEGEEESGEEDAAEGDEEEDKAEADVDEDDRQGEGCPHLLTVAEAGKLDLMANGEGEEGLPFAPECPASAKAVGELLDGRPPKTALKLVQRVRTCTSAALGAEKKAKLKAFFLALLEYTLKSMAREDGDLSVRGAAVMHALRGPLVELASELPQEAYGFFVPRLAAMGKARLPRASEFACLKLITLLFPVTDLQHPICTPASILADHWATNLAKLGAGIEDLVSEGTMLWEILYELCLPGRRFCASFFRLGTALLETCLASTGAGRGPCLQAASAIAALLCQALRALADEDAAAAAVTARRLVAEPARRLAAAAAAAAGAAGADAAAAALAEVLKQLDRLCQELAGRGLEPLSLFVSAPAQIKVLDPIFHEVGDRPQKGMELSETKQLQRKLSKERRSAARQLARDASTLQRLQGQKDEDRRTKRTTEKKRVVRIMEEEKQMLKLLMTESGGGMDTSLQRYSRKKEQKKENRRVGGSATAETKKETTSKPAEKAKAKKKGKGKKKG